VFEEILDERAGTIVVGERDFSRVWSFYISAAKWGTIEKPDQGHAPMRRVVLGLKNAAGSRMSICFYETSWAEGPSQTGWQPAADW
jgi:hypothetical protein